MATTGTLIAGIDRFNPVSKLKAQNASMTPRWLELSQGRESMSLAELHVQNAYWFKQPISFELTQPTLWLINEEFTRRGVAPQWRGIPRFVRSVGDGTMVVMRGNGTRRFSDATQRYLMKRWIDLEWLRVELGPKHITKQKIWQDVFSEDFDQAVRAFAKVNVVVGHGTDKGVGDGKMGPKHAASAAFRVVHKLSVPLLVRLGLTGLINRDAGELVRNAEKRIHAKIRPRMEALKERAAHALTSEEVERRLLFCLAMELAVGSPADAVKVFRWMTGETVSRQSMHEMRQKIALQCDLTTRAWISRKARVGVVSTSTS